MGLSLGCLGVLTIWQLASSRGMNPTERKRDEGEEGGREESLKTEGAVFYSLILEVTRHLFCNTGYKHRPCHNMREKPQVCECQYAGITEAILEAGYLRGAGTGARLLLHF